MPDIPPGTTVTVANDILANGEMTFARGEAVTIQQVAPNAQRPEYKYTVYSAKTGKWFQLRDQDLVSAAPPGPPGPPPGQYPPGPQAPYPGQQYGQMGGRPAARPATGGFDLSGMRTGDWLVAIGGVVMFISAFLYFGYVGFFFPLFGAGMVALVLLDRVWQIPAIVNWRGLNILFIIIGAIGTFFGILGVLGVLFWAGTTVLGVRVGIPIYWYIGAILDLVANAAVLVGGIMRYREDQ